MSLKFTDLSKRLQEAKDDTVVFAFGRFNPPTVGHAKLFKKVEAEGKNAKDHFVFGSHSFDNKKNPLNPKLKQKVLAKAFPKSNVKISSKQTPTALHIASMLYAQGKYKNLVMVAGSDRIQEFQTLLDKYNGKSGRHGEYNFDTIKVVSSGERDADATDDSGASGTKMREYAARNDYESFAKYSPQTLSDRDVKSIFNAVRKVMPKLDREEFEPIDNVREDYLLGNVFQIGDQVFDLNEKKQYKIIEHGPNFVYCEGEDGNVYTKWLSDIGDISEVRQDKDVKDKEGTQPAKYYKGLGKGTKDKRDAHFKKGAKKSDNDPSAYEPAPGDATAKTKPSKHTKKFKQMFGEVRTTEDEHSRSDSKSVSVEDLNHYPGMVDAEKSKNPDDFVAGDPDADYTAQGFDGSNAKEILDKLNKQVEKERGLTLKSFIDRQEILERKLTSAEKDKLKKLEKDVDQQDFIDRYGEEEGPSIYYATLTKMAKKEAVSPAQQAAIAIAKKKSGKYDEDGKRKDEGLWDNIRKKKERIKQGSGEKMRSKGDKGAPTPDQIARASESYEIGKDYADHTKEVTPGQSVDERDFKTDRKLKNLKTFIGKSSAGDSASRAKKRKAQRSGTPLAAGVKTATNAFNRQISKSQKIASDAASEEVEEWNIDLFLEEVDDAPIKNNDGEDEDYEASLEKMIDAYDELEDVADLYPDLDGDGDHDDDDMELQITKDAEEMGQIEDNYKWVDEVLTPAQRFKRAQAMRRVKGKIARARKIALKRPSSPEKLQKKAQRHARNLMRKKFIKGRNYADLSFAEKGAIEKRLQGKSSLIARIAMRVKPKLKKLEQLRLKNMNKVKAQGESIELESALIESNQYRVGSEMYYETFNDWKKTVDRSNLDYFDKELLDSDIGSHALYEGNHVPLDCPMMEEEKQPELNKPKAGGPKKYYVYVKDPKSGNVKKVSWGDTTGLKIKLNDPEARKSFSARHKCPTKKDKTKPGYWACRMPYFAKQLGLSGGGNYFW